MYYQYSRCIGEAFVLMLDYSFQRSLVQESKRRLCFYEGSSIPSIFFNQSKNYTAAYLTIRPFRKGSLKQGRLQYYA